MAHKNAKLTRIVGLWYTYESKTRVSIIKKGENLLRKYVASLLLFSSWFHMFLRPGNKTITIIIAI